MSYNQTVTLGGLFDLGLQARREVLGAEYVDKSVQSANDFQMGVPAHHDGVVLGICLEQARTSIAKLAAC